MKEKKTAAPKVKKIIIGNWKTNIFSSKEVTKWVTTYKKSVPKRHNALVAICSPSIFIPTLAAAKSPTILGAQDVSAFVEGSHTGEVTAAMLSGAGVKFVIIGHSERRAAGESDDMVAQKVRAALDAGITPIVCVGETSRDHGGMYLGLFKKQILGSLNGISKSDIAKCIIAYEPVYAIGAKKALEPQDVHSMTLYIKKVLIETLNLAAPCPILYGGSVFPETAHGLLHESGSDGLLIGRASVDPKQLTAIIAAA